MKYAFGALLGMAVAMAFATFSMLASSMKVDRAYRALRDSLATAQVRDTLQWADGYVRGMSDERRLHYGGTIILLYRESDSTLRVARMRAEGR